MWEMMLLRLPPNNGLHPTPLTRRSKSAILLREGVLGGDVAEGKPLARVSLTVGAPSKLGASFGVKCPRGNYVSDRVRTNHPPIPSVATARKVVQEV